MQQIALITVLYNSVSVLPDFFRSLDCQTCRDFTLYVVDNASPDNSLQTARQLAETVRFQTVFIANNRNGGIAQGNNLGIRQALADGCGWILLSNNDTVWPPDTLAALHGHACRYDAGIIVPRILNPDGSVWYAGGRWNRLRGGTRHLRNDRAGLPAVTEYAPSCCMLIHRSVIERVGTMDERFFIYYDDSDFVCRAGRAGIPVWYTPQVSIVHKEGTSTGAVSPLAQYWLSRNLLLFTHKHHSKAYWRYVLAVNLAILFTRRRAAFGLAEWQASRQGLRDGIRACRGKQPEPTLEQAWKT